MSLVSSESTNSRKDCENRSVSVVDDHGGSATRDIRVALIQ
jgi:hypothetical protein